MDDVFVYYSTSQNNRYDQNNTDILKLNDDSIFYGYCGIYNCYKCKSGTCTRCVSGYYLDFNSCWHCFEFFKLYDHYN